MTRLLLCTGKKKKIQAVLNHYEQLHKQKKLEILAKRFSTKRALFWQYEELKLLFDPKGLREHQPTKLLQGLDTHAYREQAVVLIDFQSSRVSDEMIKVKTLTLCHGYVSKAVHVKVSVEEFRETEYRKFYQTTCQLRGPVSAVTSCKDELIRENLCDPKTISYVF